jgi:hypothetical protein
MPSQDEITQKVDQIATRTDSNGFVECVHPMHKIAFDILTTS